MNRNLHNAMIAQYATPKVSGDGLLSWDKGVRCVMPSVKLYGKCQQDTLTGKNLFDPNAEAVMDGSYYGYKQYFSLPKPFTLSISLKPGKALPTNSSLGYIVKKTEDSSNFANWLVLNGEINSEYDCKLVIKETDYYMEMIGVYPPSSLPSFLDALNIQIELGSTATAYEPYCGGIPAPNPSYPMPVKCNNGKIICHGNTVLSNSNLFSGDFEWIQNTEKLWGLAVSYKYTILHLKPNTQYTIITPFGVYGKSKGFSSIYTSLNKNPVYHTYIQNAPGLCSQVATLSTDDSGNVYLVYYGTSDPGTECVYRDVHVVEGLCGQATAPGLMVAVDGSCQSTFDTQTGKLTDWWWPEIVFDGSEDEKWIAYTSTSFVGFRTGITALPEKMSRNAYWCNMLMPLAKQFTSTKPHLWCGVNTPVLFALASPKVGFPFYDETLDDFGLANWKAHLADNPMRLRVARNEPLITYTTPQKLTQPNGPGQIIQVSGDVADCPISARYLTHS